MDKIKVVPREQETRAKEERPPVTFTPSGLIPRLESENPSYAYRWVRVETRDGKQDAKNLSAKLREGWEPVKADEFPELLHSLVDFSGGMIRDKRYDGLVRHAELLLMKNSREKVDARNKYYRELNQRQIQSVDNDFFKEGDRRMPLFKEGQSVVGSFNKS